MSLIRKNDTVEVITGPYKGERGKVISVLPKKQKVLVEGINMRVKHERVRAGKDGAQIGGIVEKEMPIPVCNVMFVHKDKPVRLGVELDKDGAKHRVARGRVGNNERVDQ